MVPGDRRCLLLALLYRGLRVPPFLPFGHGTLDVSLRGAIKENLVNAFRVIARVARRTRATKAPDIIDGILFRGEAKSH